MICCFAGHSLEIHNIGIKEKLEETIEMLIEKGYTTFYNGDIGYFDKLCTKIVLHLKKKIST